MQSLKKNNKEILIHFASMGYNKKTHAEMQAKENRAHPLSLFSPSLWNPFLKFKT